MFSALIILFELKGGKRSIAGNIQFKIVACLPSFRPRKGRVELEPRDIEIIEAKRRMQSNSRFGFGRTVGQRISSIKYLGSDFLSLRKRG